MTTTVSTRRKGRNILYLIECPCGRVDFMKRSTFDERQAEEFYGDHLAVCPLGAAT
jgi:hypothetical protein